MALRREICMVYSGEDTAHTLLRYLYTLVLGLVFQLNEVTRELRAFIHRIITEKYALGPSVVPFLMPDS